MLSCTCTMRTQVRLDSNSLHVLTTRLMLQTMSKGSKTLANHLKRFQAGSFKIAADWTATLVTTAVETAARKVSCTPPAAAHAHVSCLPTDPMPAPFVTANGEVAGVWRMRSSMTGAADIVWRPVAAVPEIETATFPFRCAYHYDAPHSSPARTVSLVCSRERGKHVTLQS